MKLYHLFIAVCLFFFIPLKAQEVLPKTGEKIFNMGATVGFNTDMLIINSLSIDDFELENVSVKNKVNQLASVFCRINIERFFLQPSISWRKSESDIQFSMPQLEDFASMSTASTSPVILKMKKYSLQMPIMVGYHIVKQDRYGLSFLVGPNFKYNYDVSYQSHTTDFAHAFLSESTPWGLGITTGVAVNIWKLFFDFSYEFGLNQTDSDFKNKYSESDTKYNLSIDKRTNVMSFSLGIVF